MLAVAAAVASVAERRSTVPGIAEYTGIMLCELLQLLLSWLHLPQHRLPS